MRFKILDTWGETPKDAKSQIFLVWDDWNDYSFLTLFGIYYINEKSEKIDLGALKIGFFGQKGSERKLSIGDEFTELGKEFFSVGVDVGYYEKLNLLGESIRDEILTALKDIAYFPDLYNRAILEEVTKVSLLRYISETTITGQLRRLARGGSKLTSYNFSFATPKITGGYSPIELTFEVIPETNPPTNIHIVIGRNGVGKTHLIHSMVESLTKDSFQDKDFIGKFTTTDSETPRLFANLVCVTFSAFDDFDHPLERRDKSTGLPYSYIGLKKIQNKENSNSTKDPSLLADEFVKSIINCRNNAKSSIWKRAISILESDPIFAAANISYLIEQSSIDKTMIFSNEIFKRLSSGHKIVLLTLTRLIETVQERSLVLFDEPESHLHPPLLSSFIRAVSDLLIDRNGVAIIATHSPVILQEVPKSCVWKLRRNGQEVIGERLQIESFGENVGILTQEVFGLELTDSGFHRILKELVRTTDSYEEAIEVLNNNLGLEAKALLRSMFYQKSK